METVYIETTVVSYLVSEPSRDLIIAGHQQITREWWDRQCPNFDCVVSQFVLDEAAAGDARQAERRLAAVRGLRLVAVTPAVIELAEEFIRSGALPARSARDAYHVAAAAVHRLDYLVTWNCRHIANGQILKKLQQVCVRDGYELPVVCTLEELMGDYGNEI
jgi:predicted nucleic acid-binding protein